MTHPNHDPTQVLERAQKETILAAAKLARSPHQALDPDMFERVSAEQVRLGNALLGAFARPMHGEHVLSSIQDVLAEVTGTVDLRLDLHSLRVMSPDEPWPDVGHAACWRMELPPSPDYGVLCVDHAMIDPVLSSMLNEPAGSARRMAPLSARDHGLFGFVVLRCFDALVERHGCPPCVVAVEPPSRDERRHLMRRAGGGLVQVVLLASTTKGAGFVRLFLPETMVWALTAWRETHHHRRRPYCGALMQSEVSLDLCIASQSLKPMTIWELEPGDLLVPTHVGLAKAHLEELELSESCAGLAHLYLSDTRALRVCVHAQRGAWQCTIQDIHPIEMNQGVQAMSDDSHTADLSTDVPIKLEVRLASVTVRVSELAQMQPGQVLELGVPLGSPVALVAGGEQVGTGELVNVEGSLGVRVMTRS